MVPPIYSSSPRKLGRCYACSQLSNTHSSARSTASFGSRTGRCARPAGRPYSTYSSSSMTLCWTPTPARSRQGAGLGHGPRPLDPAPQRMRQQARNGAVGAGSSKEAKVTTSGESLFALVCSRCSKTLIYVQDNVLVMNSIVIEYLMDAAHNEAPQLPVGCPSFHLRPPGRVHRPCRSSNRMAMQGGYRTEIPLRCFRPLQVVSYQLPRAQPINDSMTGP